MVSYLGWLFSRLLPGIRLGATFVVGRKHDVFSRKKPPGKKTSPPSTTNYVWHSLGIPPSNSWAKRRTETRDVVVK